MEYFDTSSKVSYQGDKKMARTKRDMAIEMADYDRPPARSAIEQENRCISLAMDLAERKLRDGTASSQLISQFVKYGSSHERLERENQELNNQLLVAKTEQIRSAERVEELYADAIQAMRSYGGYNEA